MNCPKCNDKKPEVKQQTQKRWVTPSECRAKGCKYCVYGTLSKNGARCPFEKCPY